MTIADITRDKLTEPRVNRITSDVLANSRYSLRDCAFIQLMLNLLNDSHKGDMVEGVHRFLIQSDTEEGIRFDPISPEVALRVNKHILHVEARVCLNITSSIKFATTIACSPTTGLSWFGRLKQYLQVGTPSKEMRWAGLGIIVEDPEECNTLKEENRSIYIRKLEAEDEWGLEVYDRYHTTDEKLESKEPCLLDKFNTIPGDYSSKGLLLAIRGVLIKNNLME